MDSPQRPVPTAHDRLLLVMASVIAAHLVRDFDSRDFNGAGTPRMNATMGKSLDVAGALLKRFYTQRR